ncbi:MAG: hypothetical protein ACJZ2J_01125 [Candidatus Poseidoniales archaeon]
MSSAYKLSKFTPQGIKSFELSLHKKEVNFNEKGLVVPISRIEIEDKKFNSKFDFARYIYNILKTVKEDNPKKSFENDVGMWAWLSFVYLDQIAPAKNGIRDVKEIYRYIPDSDWRYKTRNLLMGSYFLYRRYGKYARIFLCNKINELGDFTEQIASRRDIAASDSLIKAIDSLYWDSERNYYKRGSGSAGKPGTLRRFIKVQQQLGINFYFNKMNEKAIIRMLPDEFNKWKNNEI